MEALRSHNFLAAASSRAGAAGFLRAQSLYRGKNKGKKIKTMSAELYPSFYSAKRQKQKLWLKRYSTKLKQISPKVTVIKIHVHLHLPIVEAALVCQTLLHSTVDTGLGSFPGTFNNHHQD